MKLIHGKTLSESLREDGVSKHGLHWLPIIQQVTYAIASAHWQGIFHRDIKPSNIMVANYGEVYVMDWGLSGFQPTTEQSPKSNDSDSPLHPSLTDGGKLFGTPNYMPPELELARVNRSTPQVDIYSLGALLCELLVGRTLRQITGEADTQPLPSWPTRSTATTPRSRSEYAKRNRMRKWRSIVTA